MLEKKKLVRKILTKKQRDIIVGTCLGGVCEIKCIEKKKKKLYSLEFKHKNLNFILDLFENFLIYTLLDYPTEIKKFNNIIYYKFSTNFISSLRFYYNTFYDRKGSFIRPRELHMLLGDRGLSYWYMSNGFLNKTNYHIYLNLELFNSDIDFIYLQRLLKEKFNIYVSIQKNKKNYRFYVLKKSKQYFISCVWSYLLKDIANNLLESYNLDKGLVKW